MKQADEYVSVMVSEGFLAPRNERFVRVFLDDPNVMNYEPDVDEIKYYAVGRASEWISIKFKKFLFENGYFVKEDGFKYPVVECQQVKDVKLTILNCMLWVKDLNKMKIRQFEIYVKTESGKYGYLWIRDPETQDFKRLAKIAVWFAQYINIYYGVETNQINSVNELNKLMEKYFF